MTIPVSCVVETDKGDFCWVQTPDGPKRRSIQLGDTNDVFIIVKAGLKEGDEVVLNPLAVIEEAKKDAANTLQDSVNAKVTPPVTTEINTEVTGGK